MYANRIKQSVGLAAVVLATLTAGCGQYIRDGRSPSRVIITRLSASSGADPDKLSEHLYSDVITVVRTTPPGTKTEIGVPTIFADNGSVAMIIVLKDQGTAGITAEPTLLNQVMITRYRVTYRRTDGRNTPGVDVPYPFEYGVTFTVPEKDIVTAGFELVRHTAKKEAPLAALTSSPVIISTIADVTFYGKDLAGNDVSVTGSIGVDFGNFGDPD